MRYSSNVKTTPQTVSGTTEIDSASLWLDQAYGYAWQAIWVDNGALAGTLKIQASIDGITWSDIPGTSETVTGSNSFLWNITTAFYMYTRCVFNPSAGAGTMQFFSSTKGP